MGKDDICITKEQLEIRGLRSALDRAEKEIEIFRANEDNKQEVIDNQRCRIECFESELASLRAVLDSITDNGRLRARHFEVWAEKIQKEQGYESELVALLKRIQQAIAQVDKSADIAHKEE